MFQNVLVERRFNFSCRRSVQVCSLLEDAQSHRYSLDREDEASEVKMKAMYREMQRYLVSNDRLFD